MLCIGFGAFINGNKVLAQNMMRARVAAQFGTIAVMGAAAKGYFGSEPSKEATTPNAEPKPAVV